MRDVRKMTEANSDLSLRDDRFCKQKGRGEESKDTFYSHDRVS
jgi:hypothetical protein